MNAAQINIIIIDDHALVRMGIKRLLRDTKDIKVIAEAGTGEEAIKIAKTEQFDIALLDIMLPDMNGLEILRRLQRVKPEIKIVVLTACIANPYPKYFLQAGVSGYLPKECHYKEMIEAIRTVFQGKRYINNVIAHLLALESIDNTQEDEQRFKQLSNRELQIMMLITAGTKVADIARQLSLSSKTVNSYRYRIFEKLNISNDVDLTRLAFRLGLLEQNLGLLTKK